MNEVPDTFPWMFRGYLVMGAIVVAYLFTLAKRLRTLEREARAGRDRN